MAVNFDWFWTPEPDGCSRVRQVYRNKRSIGRVRRWRGQGSGEWFTAELMTGARYEPIEGKRETFREALGCIVMYGVGQEPTLPPTPNRPPAPVRRRGTLGG